jgi:hypothetical protein
LVRSVVEACDALNCPVIVEDDCETKPDWNVWSAVHVLAIAKVVEPSLLLKLVQSVVERQPGSVALAVAQPMLRMPPSETLPPPVKPVPAVMVVEETERRLEPIVEVATTCPSALVERSEFVSEVR